MLDGVLKVEKYDDRFVFTNPGLLKIPVEQIYAGYETRARNQRIQNLFRMIGLGENLGSGFPLILSACNEKHWLEPELIEQPELMQVKLILHIVSEEDAVKRQANVGKDVGKDVGNAGERHRCYADGVPMMNLILSLRPENWPFRLKCLYLSSLNRSLNVRYYLVKNRKQRWLDGHRI